MPKMTLLEIVQDILNDLNDDPVNSINDTVEAGQVAQIVKTTYFEMMSGDRFWPHLKEINQLTSFADSEKPTHMSFPDAVQRILYIKYDVQTESGGKKLYTDIKYKEPEAFLEYLNDRDSTASNVKTVSDNVDLLIRTDLQPSFWTSFDDETIIFDAHYSDLDSVLQDSKTQTGFIKEPSWSHVDAATPDLPANAFSFLLSEAKSTCFATLKQAANPKEEQRSRRQRIFLSQESWKTNGGIKRPNYGRVPPLTGNRKSGLFGR